jgi:hypothetical protein
MTLDSLSWMRHSLDKRLSQRDGLTTCMAKSSAEPVGLAQQMPGEMHHLPIS